jgi:hypothetical protein
MQADKDRPVFRIRTRLSLIFPTIFLILAILSCNVSLGTDSGLQQTQAALGVQQTVQAQLNSNTGATQTAQHALQAVPPTQAPPPPIPPTPVVAPIMVDTAVPPPAQPSPQPQQPQQTQPPQQPSAGFDEWMKTATILVYEDIVADPSLAQYVKKTLDGMGLQYKWDGNAMGRFKSDLLAGGPNGQPWDLIIVAVEWREDISGEYFEYLNNSLNQGSSLILEAFHLDDISEGTVSTILNHCGVTVYPYFTKTGTVNDAIMWPLPNASSHPVLSNPNAGMTFTNALDTWLWSFDLGSLMAVTGQGDAQLLLGTKAQEAYQDGTLAVCMGGQLILQTFSSHSFPYSTMGPLWENYITNALAKRHQGQ